MFKNYYTILGIPECANIKQIKDAYRTQAKKWHPDRNPGEDTTARMRDVNEAMLILCDQEARRHYDEEFKIFRSFQKTTEQASQHNQSTNFSTTQSSSSTSKTTNTFQQQNKQAEENYEYSDLVLKNWILNAQKQAIELTREALREGSQMVVEGVKGGAKYAWTGIKIYFVVLLIALLVLAIMSSGKN